MAVAQSASEAPSEELDDLRLILARRLAKVWSNDPDNTVADEARAWLEWALDAREEQRELDRRTAESLRLRLRRSREKLDGEAARQLSASIPISVASNRIEHGVRADERRLFNVARFLATTISRAHDNEPESQSLAKRALEALCRLVIRVPYEETAEIAWLLGAGKTNAPQTIVALALAELGWSTARIATTLPAAERVVGDGKPSKAKDKAQVRRMVRAARSP